MWTCDLHKTHGNDEPCWSCQSEIFRLRAELAAFKEETAQQRGTIERITYEAKQSSRILEEQLAAANARAEKAEQDVAGEREWRRQVEYERDSAAHGKEKVEAALRDRIMCHAKCEEKPGTGRCRAYDVLMRNCDDLPARAALGEDTK